MYFVFHMFSFYSSVNADISTTMTYYSSILDFNLRMQNAEYVLSLCLHLFELSLFLSFSIIHYPYEFAYSFDYCVCPFVEHASVVKLW